MTAFGEDVYQPSRVIVVLLTLYLCTIWRELCSFEFSSVSLQCGQQLRTWTLADSVLEIVHPNQSNLAHLDSVRALGQIQGRIHEQVHYGWWNYVGGKTLLRRVFRKLLRILDLGAVPRKRARSDPLPAGTDFDRSHCRPPCCTKECTAKECTRTKHRDPCQRQTCEKIYSAGNRDECSWQRMEYQEHVADCTRVYAGYLTLFEVLI